MSRLRNRDVDSRFHRTAELGCPARCAANSSATVIPALWASTSGSAGVATGSLHAASATSIAQAIATVGFRIERFLVLELSAPCPDGADGPARRASLPGERYLLGVVVLIDTGTP